MRGVPPFPPVSGGAAAAPRRPGRHQRQMPSSQTSGQPIRAGGCGRSSPRWPSQTRAATKGAEAGLSLLVSEPVQRWPWLHRVWTRVQALEKMDDDAASISQRMMDEQEFEQYVIALKF